MQSFPPAIPSPNLRAILTPPDQVSGTPGEAVSLGVVIQNVGDRGAIINVFINEDSDATVLEWCRVSRQRLALDPQQKEELVFDFTLPATANAATYDYLLVIDAPGSYPEDPPLQYPLQLRVLFKEQTVMRQNDPTFFINPATNPQKPAPLNPGNALQFQVRVDNRSNKVDNYRISCPDLEEDWYRIRYPQSNLGEFGLVAEAGSLDLNPGTQGVIQLEICPPTQALAGVYIPSIYLHSSVMPDLRRLDCVYFEIQRVETLDVELETMIGRVSTSAGQYHLNLKNTGNVIRQLRFSASSRDEDEVCTYSFDPPGVRLLPDQTAQVLLLATPNQPKQRPFWGMGQTINFQVAIQDADGYRVPDRPVQGSLTWKARPWWQLLLIVLLALGLLAGVILLVRFIFQSPPKPEIAKFSATSSNAVEGEKVQLEWIVLNPKQVRRMEITASPQVQGFPINRTPEECQILQQDQIRCEVSLEALSAQNYNFTLELFNQRGQSLGQKPAPVSIARRPPPQITSLDPVKTSYTRNEPLQFNFRINNSDQVNDLTLIATSGKDQSNVRIPILSSKNKQGILSQADIQPASGMPDLRPICGTSNPAIIICTGLPIRPLSRAGNYTFTLEVTPVPLADGTVQQPIASKPTSTVTIQPQRLTLRAFLNGRSDTYLLLNEKDENSLSLRWRADGGEGNVQVTVDGTSRSKSDTLTLPPLQPGETRRIELLASDESGQPPQQVTFTIVRPMPTPTPTPPPSVSPPPSPASSP